MAGCGTLLAALVFTTLVSYSYQLRCYECNEVTSSRKIIVRPTNISMRDVAADCGSFAESTQVECPADADSCYKTVMTYPGGEASTHGCGTADACSAMDGTEAQGVKINCYSCDTNGCNGAAGMTAATSLLAITLLIAKLY